MPRLLIADDDAVDRELARRCLAAIEDLEIVEAEDGRQALDVVEKQPPDVVLTDLRMPELDGLELVRRVSAGWPQLPVILMTSRGSEQIAVEALSSGAASYVPKGELPEVLGEIVEQMLGVAAARAERAAVLSCLEASESSFRLENDPALITPLVAYLQDGLERIGFGDEKVRSQIGTALLEALSNAMIHGNLEVSSRLRRNGTEPYHREIEKRRVTRPFSERRVRLKTDERVERVVYLVRDEGPGFDTSSLPDPTRPESMLKAEGRGLFLIHAFMDEVEHNETGNEIRMVKRA